MSDTKPDLDAIEARANAATGKQWRVVDCDYVVSGNQNVAQTLWALADAEFIAHAREDVPALVARIRALEAELHQLGETHALRSAAHDRLAQRLDQIRHEVETYRAAMPAFSALYSDHRGILTDDARRRAHLALTYPRHALDGDQQTKEAP